MHFEMDFDDSSVLVKSFTNSTGSRFLVFAASVFTEMLSPFKLK